MSKAETIFLESKDHTKSGVIWNMAANLLFAFQSTIIFFVFQRLGNDSVSGMFRFVFTEATLFLMIGKYGLRDYQISDIKNKFSFFDYKAAKFATVILMLIVSLGYTIFEAKVENFTLVDASCLFLMCSLKTHDAIEEVYYAHYQKNLRLDIAGKTMFARLSITTITIVIASIVSRDLLVPLFAGNVVSALLLIYFIAVIYPKSQIKESDLRFFARSSVENNNRKAQIMPILLIGFPLFLGIFLQNYVNAAIVSAIKALLTDADNTIYGIISMPVFVIDLMSGVIYSPLIIKLAEAWRVRDVKKFFKMIGLQLFLIAALTLVCIAGAYFLGVPVLSLVFNQDITLYKSDLLILLLGGGFLAIARFVVSITIVIRYEKATCIGYIVGGLAALVMARSMVGKYGIHGAANSYTLITALTSIVFAVIFFIGYKKNVNKIVN